MCAAQFENFAVERIKSWLNQNIQPGAKYQLRSANVNNTIRLYNEICQNALSFDYNGTALNYLLVNDIRVIFAAHFDEHEAPAHFYNEHYISRLRDCVSSNTGEFENTALIFIHNSTLDTLEKNAIDLAHGDMPWSTQSIKNQLHALIISQPKHNHALSHLFEDESRAT